MSDLICSKDRPLIQQVVRDLERHEGFEEYAYADPLTPLYAKYKSTGKWGKAPALSFMKAGEDLTKGNPWTYGFGFTHGVNPESRITRLLAERQLEELILKMNDTLSKKLRWYTEATFVTKTVLINMGFNLGVEGLLNFKNTLAFLKERKYTSTARGMLNSLWAKQVGYRAKELASRIETQTINPAH